MTPRGAYAIAWALIAALYTAVAVAFPREVGVMGAALWALIARFADALALGLFVSAVIVASAMVLAAAKSAER